MTCPSTVHRALTTERARYCSTRLLTKPSTLTRFANYPLPPVPVNGDPAHICRRFGPTLSLNLYRLRQRIFYKSTDSLIHIRIISSFVCNTLSFSIDHDQQSCMGTSSQRPCRDHMQVEPPSHMSNAPTQQPSPSLKSCTCKRLHNPNIMKIIKTSTESLARTHHKPCTTAGRPEQQGSPWPRAPLRRSWSSSFVHTSTPRYHHHHKEGNGRI